MKMQVEVNAGVFGAVTLDVEYEIDNGPRVLHAWWGSGSDFWPVLTSSARESIAFEVDARHGREEKLREDARMLAQDVRKAL